MRIGPQNWLAPVQAQCVWGRRLKRTVEEFAILGPDGKTLRHTAVKTGQFRSVTPVNPHVPRSPRQVDGPVLFAGIAPLQFGHTLLNSLGRLWALEDLPEDTRLFYISKEEATQDRHPFLRKILDQLGIRNEVTVSREPLAFSQLYAATEIFGEVHDGRGLPSFYGWVDAQLPPAPPVDRDRKVYVTRSQLGPWNGRYACEPHLERLLSQEGYQIFAPELHDLTMQIEVLRTAGRIVFAEGSALHLFGLVARPDQKAVMIKRRHDMPELITTQMQDRLGVTVQVIDAIRQMYYPPRPNKHMGVSTLDFGALHRHLFDLGMIEVRQSWADPAPANVIASLASSLRPGERMLDWDGHERYAASRRRRARLRRQRELEPHVS